MRWFIRSNCETNGHGFLWMKTEVGKLLVGLFGAEMLLLMIIRLVPSSSSWWPTRQPTNKHFVTFMIHALADSVSRTRTVFMVDRRCRRYWRHLYHQRHLVHLFQLDLLSYGDTDPCLRLAFGLMIYWEMNWLSTENKRSLKIAENRWEEKWDYQDFALEDHVLVTPWRPRLMVMFTLCKFNQSLVIVSPFSRMIYISSWEIQDPCNFYREIPKKSFEEKNMAKRTAISDLNHHNWNEDEDPEEELFHLEMSDEGSGGRGKRSKLVRHTGLKSEQKCNLGEFKFNIFDIFFSKNVYFI